jgi:ribosomal RNA-processing protein 12
MRYHGQTVGHADPTVTMEEGENNNKSSNPTDEEMLAEEEHETVPTNITLKSAQNAVKALQKDAETWLPLLLNSFVTSHANQRGHIGAAVAAYACICDPSSIATLFRAAIMKLMKVQEQARTGELGRDAVFEGGESDTERVCTFMEASLLLAGGLDVAGIQVLWKAAIPGTKEKDPAIQKKSYKIIAYLCESRQDFVHPHFTDVLGVLLQGTGTAVSAAKRYRLRCLKASILELVTWEGDELDLSSVPGIEEAVAMSSSCAADGARLVITPMVTEIILCVKEANKRTRASAFDLLIEVATAMHEAEPPTISMDDGDEEEGAELVNGASASAHGGGLHSLVTIVLGGLIGSTPHMISASVMALARLLFEFAPVLAGLVPTLLPSVLLLLRSKAREVIKAVLGFVKVVVMRLQTAELLQFTPAICEGILLWAEDSKNKFRLKVRVILERIARRCGFEALETAVPESHRALLTHIRKQHHRKERKRNNNGATEMDWNAAGVDDDDEDDGRSRKSGKAGTARTARTAAKSAWNSEMFSDEEDDDNLGLRAGGGGRSEGGRTMRTAGGKSGVTGGSRSVRSAANQAGNNGRRLPSSGDDPIDLLDAGIARKMVRGGVIGGSGGGGGGNTKNAAKGAGEIDFETNKDGRMVIREEVPLIGKRKRSGNDAADAGFDSADSDFEDLKGYSGLALALRGSKSVGQAASIAASLGGKSLGAKSMGARSMGGRSQRTSATAATDGKQNRRGGQHSGDRFKAKKSGAGGDVKGNSKVEPYAYWPLDRKMLNRRVQKTKTAKSGLDRVVNSAAKAGTAKGQKAKRARQ